MRKETPPSSSLRKICLDLCARKRFAHFSCHYVTQQIQKQIQDSHKIRLDLWLQGNTFHSLVVVAQHFPQSGNDIWWQNQKNLQASLQVTAEHQNANEMKYMCLWNLKLGLRWLRWCTLCTSCQWANCLWQSFRIAAQWIGTGWQQCTIGWRWMEKDMSRWWWMARSEASLARLNTPSFPSSPQITTLNSRNGPTSFVSCPQLILDKSTG